MPHGHRARPGRARPWRSFPRATPGIYGMAELAIELAHAEENPPAGSKPAGGCPFPIQIRPGRHGGERGRRQAAAPRSCWTSPSSASATSWSPGTSFAGLKAVATADLVVALYNPKSSHASGSSRKPSRYSSNTAPRKPQVRLAAAVGTEDERLTLSTLGSVLNDDVDMRTIVIIGNSMSKVIEGWFLASGGYSI